MKKKVSKKLIKIVLEEDNIKTEAKSGGKRVARNINVEDFRNAFAGNLVLRTGIMSPGIRYYSKKGDKEYIVVECPPKVRQTRCKRYKEGTINLPMPPTVFFFVITNGKLTSSKCFCIKKPIGESGQKLYHFPFGNTYNSGKICWGHSRKSFKGNLSLSNIASLIDIFFSSGFNNDLESRLTTEAWKKIGVYNSAVATVRYFDGKKDFPVKFLLETGSNTKTYIKNFDKAG